MIYGCTTSSATLFNKSCLQIYKYKCDFVRAVHDQRKRIGAAAISDFQSRQALPVIELQKQSICDILKVNYISSCARDFGVESQLDANGIHSFSTCRGVSLMLTVSSAVLQSA